MSDDTRGRVLQAAFCATLHAVCAVQFVDGAQQTGGSTGMSAPANGEKASNEAKNNRNAFENA